jgi:HEAT repeat protein
MNFTRATTWVILLVSAAGCQRGDITPPPPASTTLQNIDAQLDMLRRGTVDRKILAARWLANSGSSRSIQPLMAALGSTQPRVRAAAARALGRLQAHQAVMRLGAALSDTDPHVRAEAAMALQTIADPMAIPSLLDAMDDPHPVMADRVTSALAAIGRPAIEPVSDRAVHADGLWRERAIRALAKMDEPGANHAAVRINDMPSNEETD